MQATALYLGGYQLIPFQRLAETLSELFGCPLSQGTLANFIKRGGGKASEAMVPVREALLEAPVAHGDETGCTLHGRRHWLHVFSTGSLTCFHIDAKRGSQAMERMGLLAGFRGIPLHDFLSAYYRFKNCRHFLCNAHLLRELTYLHEQLPMKKIIITSIVALAAVRISAEELPKPPSGDPALRAYFGFSSIVSHTNPPPGTRYFICTFAKFKRREFVG